MVDHQALKSAFGKADSTLRKERLKYELEVTENYNIEVPFLVKNNPETSTFLGRINRLDMWAIKREGRTLTLACSFPGNVTGSGDREVIAKYAQLAMRQAPQDFATTTVAQLYDLRFKAAAPDAFAIAKERALLLGLATEDDFAWEDLARRREEGLF